MANISVCQRIGTFLTDNGIFIEGSGGTIEDFLEVYKSVDDEDGITLYLRPNDSLGVARVAYVYEKPEEKTALRVSSTTSFMILRNSEEGGRVWPLVEIETPSSSFARACPRIFLRYDR